MDSNIGFNGDIIYLIQKYKSKGDFVMKKVFALLLVLVMAFSFASCDDEKKASSKNDKSDKVVVSEEVAEGGKKEAEGPKRTSTASTKLLRYYEDVLQSNRFTLKMTSTMNNMTSEVMVVRDGDMMYSESKVSTIVMKQIVRDGNQYLIYPNGKIMKVSYPGPITLPNEVNIIDKNQLQYYETYASSGTTEHNGKSYSYEEFSIGGLSVQYLFDGDDLKFVKQKVGQLELVSEVSVTYTADTSLFTVPSGEITEMQVPNIQ